QALKRGTGQADGRGQQSQLEIRALERPEDLVPIEPPGEADHAGPDHEPDRDPDSEQKPLPGGRHDARNLVTGPSRALARNWTAWASPGAARAWVPSWPARPPERAADLEPPANPARPPAAASRHISAPARRQNRWAAAALPADP